MTIHNINQAIAWKAQPACYEGSSKHGNSLIDIMNSHVIKDATVFNKWTDALTAPFSEEFFKALVAFWVVLMVGKKDLKTILIAGLGSGFGFQIIEDLGYVARQTKTSQLAAVTEAINRISVD